MGWIPVKGGRLGDREWHRAADVADLWWSDTSLAHEGLPVVDLTMYQASRVAELLGARLPTSVEWEWMASRGHRLYPWGDQDPTEQHANLRPWSPGRTTPGRAHPAGRTPEGVWDVAGNSWEWTLAPWRRDGAALLRGGSYHSLVQYASCRHANDVLPGLASPGIGLRLVRDTDPTTQMGAPR
ncbi:SUMF1/EgtB/PvdO family nonheme iron enzyme [Streptomyces sp. BE20]|uniref:formylglycine-generating enzyme family protein n=1 Tax=Streptomyces sp. BE20 TaxID=3002525 RepID=UPI002E76886C|nr:SUMF1/EgtB/PvdO family nonheme iron enzyme [Streptomyces sp. BE20]MEE1823888.1 SUMF1/EgtB/PvdO family nonheme iron enzyme [Streptomyces sp. BE20]